MSKKQGTNNLNTVDSELLSPELEEAAKNVPPEIVNKIVKVTTKRVTSELWMGPLPPPALFNQYPKEVQKAIVTQATAQMKHRHQIENKVVASNTKSSERGMTFAFWLTIAMLVAGTVLVMMGQSTAGLVAIFGPAGFHGGNYLFQKWREMQKASQKARRQNQNHIQQQETQQGTTVEG